MKRFIAFFLTVLLLLSLWGCSGNNPEHTTHNHTHTEAITAWDTTTFEENTVTLPNTETTSSQNNPSSESSAPTDPSAVILSDTLERGTTEGNIYTSTTLGLTFEKPSEWTFAEESDLAYYSGLLSGGFGDFAATASENPAVYDMYADHKESGTTLSICYENLFITVGNALSAGEYAGIIKNAVSENPDSTVTFEGEITLGDRLYSKLTVKTASDNDSTLRTYYLTQVGNYMATILATVPEGAIFDTDSMFR
ncbi:MAG: hypothetical protein IJA62_02845 [Ruminococcus sp.]|nr:hypothetical protein [Ruminococcus sp.]